MSKARRDLRSWANLNKPLEASKGVQLGSTVSTDDCESHLSSEGLCLNPGHLYERLSGDHTSH